MKIVYFLYAPLMLNTVFTHLHGTETAFFQAVKDNQRQKVWKFLDREGMVSARNALGQTALHVAAMRGNLPLVKLLIAHGADVNAIDKQNYNVLFHALCTRHWDVIDYLLSHGAEHNRSFPSITLGSDDTTPDHCSICLEEFLDQEDNVKLNAIMLVKCYEICNALFHHHCMLEWKESLYGPTYCPHCKQHTPILTFFNIDAPKKTDTEPTPLPRKKRKKKKHLLHQDTTRC